MFYNSFCFGSARNLNCLKSSNFLGPHDFLDGIYNSGCALCSKVPLIFYDFWDFVDEWIENTKSDTYCRIKTNYEELENEPEIVVAPSVKITLVE